MRSTRTLPCSTVTRTASGSCVTQNAVPSTVMRTSPASTMKRRSSPRRTSYSTRPVACTSRTSSSVWCTTSIFAPSCSVAIEPSPSATAAAGRLGIAGSERVGSGGSKATSEAPPVSSGVRTAYLHDTTPMATAAAAAMPAIQRRRVGRAASRRSSSASTRPSTRRSRNGSHATSCARICAIASSFTRHLPAARRCARVDGRTPRCGA
jgi:hypothetical protein